MPRDFSSDWEHIRSKGKARYLFIHGVLLWGLPMNIVMNLYLHFRAGYPWTPTLYYTIPHPIGHGYSMGMPHVVFVREEVQATQ